VAGGLVRHIVDAPAGVSQSPDEIDVLAELKLLVESAREGAFSHHQRGTRDIRDTEPRADKALCRAEIERATGACEPTKSG
jgi:hypothetical protein